MGLDGQFDPPPLAIENARLRDEVRQLREERARWLQALEANAKMKDDAWSKLAASSRQRELAEAVVEAARQWSDAIEQGFASKVRPDIARAMFVRALTAYDSARAGDTTGGK